jgi:glutamate--cysteine ligase
MAGAPHRRARRPAGSRGAACGTRPYAPPRSTRDPRHAPPGRCTITVEPGGQVELASPPLAPFGTLVRTVVADAELLHGRLAARGIAVSPHAADPVRPARRVLDLPRYRAMERRFDRVGPWGRSGMCSTAAVQVCLDAGEGVEVARRWEALHALGPVLVGAFANSPVLHGRRTGWKSSRLAAWLALDPQRTAPASVRGDRRRRGPGGCSTELLCVRRADGRWDAPPGVTFAAWIRGHPSCLRRRPRTSTTTSPPSSRRCARGHLRSATSTPTGRGGRSRRRCWRCWPARRDGPGAAGVRAQPAVGSRPPATGSQTGCCSVPRSRCSSWR